MRRLKNRKAEIALAVVLILNVLLWLETRHAQALWVNVPPAPSVSGATAFMLGDRQMAYRALGIMVQNLGDTGGRITSLADYDYDELAKWFFLGHALDPRSDFFPFLAAYYFGSVQEPARLPPLLGYLEIAGQYPEGRKWRWLGQAVWLARYRMNDLDRALELAEILAAHKNPDRPAWTYRMPALVMTARGEKEASYEFMFNLLQSSAEKMHPNEVYFMREYMCTRLLDAAQAIGNPLCEDIDFSATSSGG